MKGLILAGGPGTGLRPLTLNTPKPIIPIANQPMVLYQLALLKGAGIEEILLSLSYQPRKIEDLLKDGADFGVMVRYRSEKTAMGPLGALRTAADWLEGTTLILGAGLLTNTDLSAATHFHRDRKSMATFVLPDDEIHRMGVTVDEAGRVVDGPASPKAAASPGVFFLEPEVLEYVDPEAPDSIEEDLIGHLSARRVPVFVHRTRAYWKQIDSPERYLEAHADILKGRFPLDSFRLGGVEITPPVSGGSLIAPGANLHQTAHVEASVIGPNCSISAGARVVDSVLWSGNSVGERTEIQGSILGRGCFVGSSVVLGPGTVLGGKSSITEFSRFSPR